MRGLLTEFRTFVLRGNVVDLAVGIVIGAAFGTVVQAFVKDLLTPLIAAIFGQPDFSALTFQPRLPARIIELSCSSPPPEP